MDDKILTLASAMTRPSEREEPLLGALAAASAAELRQRLDPGVAPGDCPDAFACAAAMTAAARFLAARAEETSFTAGDVSVKGAGAAAVSVLLEQARRLMAPYAASGEFAFRGVRG